jgi:prepilin-type N-terminal cleavage/methylation domain-containing protein
MIVRTDHSRPPIQTAGAPVRRQGAVISSQWSVISAQASGSRSRPRSSEFGVRTSKGYTLLELLAVITIMGIIAALAVPTLRALKPNAKVAATRDLLDAVGRARQLAISQRTTVYMVFLSTNLSGFLSSASVTNSWKINDLYAANSLLDKQLTGYAYVSLRSIGDQPGVYHPTYLSSWRTLPQGAYIPPGKFGPALRVVLTNTALGGLMIPYFSVTNTIPFPLETTQPIQPPTSPPRYASLSYIAFNGMGQLVSGVPGQPELIPVSEGIVSVARDPNTKVALPGQAPTVLELPPRNTLENYSLVYIDRLTGRAHVERRKVQ